MLMQLITVSRFQVSMSSREIYVDTSLASQTPYFSEEREKESGNTAYNEFYLAKECGATNEIASLLISIRH